MAHSPLVTFYLGRGSDIEGRRFEDMVMWSDWVLENTHDYIQWLFPLKDASAYSSSAPLLTDEDIAAFKDYQTLRSNLLLAHARMLDFYGFTIVLKSGYFEIVRSENFVEKTQHWLTPNNHNFLRITRILKSLVLLDCSKHALAFFAALEKVYSEYAGVIGERTCGFWKEAVTLTIVITQYSTHKSARCDCSWESISKRQLMKNVYNHATLHRNRDKVTVILRERTFRAKIIDK
ncbi:MAG: hypothetical protein A3H69_05595 [Candidatus Sungbacteria bacterium RIFCSPLOWO2_02_FULL_47_9]|nr:MAG: hypothetical protein A3A28_00560 [Candidatus Sungbacteria bacterium RIFCSPLOWO2_01_FULL_47_32]OHA09881.1 MAG: hypothetical protein A3H69_05595 [Candidatus Sungbacteria bacterium RIFCSPLOWO2_02_FULL_47_9]